MSGARRTCTPDAAHEAAEAEADNTKDAEWFLTREPEGKGVWTRIAREIIRTFNADIKLGNGGLLDGQSSRAAEPRRRR